MDLCTAPLRYSFPAQELRLYLGLLIGVGAIFGFGMCSERWMARRDGRFSVAESFLQGTVILSLAMYASSLAGYCRPAFVIAGIGCLLLAVQVVPMLLQHVRASSMQQTFASIRQKLRQRWWTWPWVGVHAYLWYLVLFFAFMFIYLPAREGDLTAIWAYHGKALSCECLLQSHFINEPYWTGTHPEYPLFLPFLHAFFFNLMDSFRDDIVSFYQSLSLVCMAAMIRKTMLRLFDSQVAVAFALIVYLAMLSNRPSSIVFFQFAELNALIFAAAIACCLLRNDRQRLWLYLIGLSFTKKEGMMAAAIGIGLLAAYSFVAPAPGLTLRQRLLQLRWLLPSLLGVGALTALNRLQPSKHEEYEKVLLDPAAWRNGLTGLTQIATGCWGILLERKIWWLTILTLPALWVGTFGAWLKTRDALWRRSHLLISWTMAMLAVFMAIYIVSPWGPGLYNLSWERLLAQIAMPSGLVVTALLATVWTRGPGWARVGSLALMMTIAYGLAGPIRWEEDVNRRIWSDLAARHLTGRHAFFHAFRGGFEFGSDPQRVAALRLDDELPPGPLAVALLDSHNFYINYLLYPRRFYSASKDTIAHGSKPFTRWQSLEEVPMTREGFKFAVKDFQVVYPAKPAANPPKPAAATPPHPQPNTDEPPETPAPR